MIELSKVKTHFNSLAWRSRHVNETISPIYLGREVRELPPQRSNSVSCFIPIRLLGITEM